MAWVYLLLAGFLEVVWTTALKYSNGFTRIVPVIVILVCAPISLYWLSVAMKSIPLGTSYAVWTGIGSIGEAIIGIMFFNDPVNFRRLASLTLVVLGIYKFKSIYPINNRLYILFAVVPGVAFGLENFIRIS